MSNITLYHFPPSAPSRGAFMVAKAVGIPIQVEHVDLFKKEQLSESFSKLNPQHCIPTLDDNGFVLWESRAIASYLVDKYGKEELYPRDLQKRAVVTQRLFFDSSALYVKIRAICYPILFMGVTEISETLKTDLNTTLGFLDLFLSKTKWVAGDEGYTIADICIFASLSSILAVGWDMTAFPNIQRWVKACTVLPGYDDNVKGAETFGGLVKKNLKQ